MRWQNRQPNTLSIRVFGYILVFLIILNCFDAFATLYWVNNGIAYESNPLMQEWLDVGNIAFIFVKTVLVFLCALCLWHLRMRPLARLLSTVALIVYVCIFIIHCNIAWKVFF